MVAKKPSWVFKQSAVVPFFVEGGKTQIVLITSLRTKKWIIPKGVIDSGMTPQASAAKEAHEEAGVIGETEDKALGEYQYKKWGGTCTVKVYPLRVVTLLDDWQEKRARERLVVGVGEAIELIHNGDVKVMMRDYFNC